MKLPESCNYADDLLRISASLLDQLLDGSEELLREWAGDRLVQAICEAAEQTRQAPNDDYSCMVHFRQPCGELPQRLPFVRPPSIFLSP